MSHSDAAVVAVLRRLGLVTAHEVPVMIPLTGGVSSDILRVELSDRTVCVKRALPRLKVGAPWKAPVARNRYEWAWLVEAERVVPGCVPPLVAQDPTTPCFVMAYLDPARYPVWKEQLRRGLAAESTAAAVGRRLGRIHAATADQSSIRARFQTDDIFRAIRLDPYLRATARRHADMAGRLHELLATTARTRRVLVHGDVSPKNILVGPGGPVFLDAECAWFGDPAFDLAFCLTHLLLKCLWTPAATAGFLRCFDTVAQAYLDEVAWEDPRALEVRAAHLLPGLLLARVDGKSPVEYLTRTEDRERVRRVARALLVDPVASLDLIRDHWRRAGAGPFP